MTKQPNIVVLMADQLRSDHVGWHPQARMDTPHLNRIAEGTAFLHCVTANPICTPARAALLTGKYARQIGLLAMAGDLSREHPTYPQALQRAGYATAGIGKFHWLQTWEWGTPRGEGLDLAALNDDLKGYGFDHVWEASGKQLAVQNRCDYCVYLEEKGMLEAFRDHIQARGSNFNEAENVMFTGAAWPFPEADYPDVVITDRMLDWLDDQGADRPFFLFGSLLSPHAPFDPPQRYLDMFPREETDDFLIGETEHPLSGETKQRMWTLRRSYKAMTKLVDDQIGRVLDKLEAMGVLENTVILFTTDHGEMLGDHGRFQKSIHWHPATVVPTAIRHPAHLHGHRVTTPVELTDLTATILDAAGLDPHRALSKSWPAYHDRVPGRSLLPLVRGDAEGVREWAFCECEGNWSMIRSDRYAFVRFHGGDDPDCHAELFFDLHADPGECHNRIADASLQDRIDWHRRRLFHMLETTPPAQTRWAPLMVEPASPWADV